MEIRCAGCNTVLEQTAVQYGRHIVKDYRCPTCRRSYRSKDGRWIGRTPVVAP